MKKKLMMVVSLALALTGFGADPGGFPGFLEATFSNSTTLNATGDIAVNFSRLTCTPNLYPSYFGPYTTVGAKAYMYLEGGVTYNFRYYYRYAYATLKINGQTILSKGSSSSSSQSGSYTPDKTDWYLIDLRAGSEGTSGGVYSSAYYGLQWKKSSSSSYSNFSDPGDGSLFKTGDLSGIHFKETTPIVLSSSIRTSDPTVMDVTYIVYSDEATVNVRALAFEDGERSFWKVVRPETFIDGTAANIGDGIAANVEHKLSWKVSSDWATELAKVKFEVLVSDIAQLPLETKEIPAAGKYPAMTVATNSQSDTDVFNALMWYYACADKDLEIKDGYLYHKDGSLLSSRDSVGNADRMRVLRFVYDRIGWDTLDNMATIGYIKNALRVNNLAFNSSTRNVAVLKNSLPSQPYVGEKAYLAVDLTTGAETYIDSMPLAGWGDEYKTTKMLFRRIEPGDVRMGDTKPVTITKPYYIGVFEVTQKQWTLVMGSNPSSYKGDMRPVERVSYNDIRGTSKGAQWPNGTEYDSSSFLGRLAAKTGKTFDLPTESQWEYACRAGTTSYFNNGGGSASDLTMVGRWATNRYDGKGGYSEHTTVGSYLPNAWGLHDMHGNVMEWCLDWYSSINSDPATDFVGAVSGSNRVRRGGSWSHDYFLIFFPSSFRDNDCPSYRYDVLGVRLCCSAPAGLQ